MSVVAYFRLFDPNYQLSDHNRKSGK